MSWKTLIVAACIAIPIWTLGCDKKRERRVGLVGRWQVVEQQRTTKCRFTATELQLFPDGKIIMSSIPQSDMIYTTEVEPEHFERLKRKYRNIEPDSTLVVLLRQRPKDEPAMGMAFRYLLKDNDTLMLEYAGCRPTAYKRAE